MQVAVDQLAPTSVTEYAWRVKFGMKPPKDAVKYSENATVKSEVEVRRLGRLATVRLVSVCLASSCRCVSNAGC